MGLQKLPLVRFNFRAWLNRTNGTGAGYTVGAAISRPSLPPWRGKVPSKARRMRVGSEMAPPQRAGQCPAPTKRRNSFYIRRRGGTPGRSHHRREPQGAPLPGIGTIRVGGRCPHRPAPKNRIIFLPQVFSTKKRQFAKIFFPDCRFIAADSILFRFPSPERSFLRPAPD